MKHPPSESPAKSNRNSNNSNKSPAKGKQQSKSMIYLLTLVNETPRRNRMITDTVSPRTNNKSSYSI